MVRRLSFLLTLAALLAFTSCRVGGDGGGDDAVSNLTLSGFTPVYNGTSMIKVKLFLKEFDFFPETFYSTASLPYEYAHLVHNDTPPS